MPLVCRIIPNRSESRPFTAADAARIICYALEGGATLGEIVERARIRCPEEAKDRPDQSQESVLEMALTNIAANNVALLDSYRLFLIINGILAALILVTRFVPSPLRLVQIIAVPARQQVGVLLQRNIVQRAANDELYNLVNAVLQASRALRRAS